jgi:hypothetical protein
MFYYRISPDRIILIDEYIVFVPLMMLIDYGIISLVRRRRLKKIRQKEDEKAKKDVEKLTEKFERFR